jgi:integrase
MAKTSGQLEERSPGHWRIRVFVGRDKSGKRQYLSRTVQGGKKKAEEELSDLIGKKRHGRLGRSDRRSIGEHLDWWIENVAEIGVRASTLASYRLVIETYLKPELGSIRLDKLTGPYVQEVVRTLTTRGLAPRTVRYAFALLNAALRRACKDRLLSRNPLEDVTLPRQPRRELQVPGESARGRLLAELQADGLWPLWCVMLTTGLRPGEALALRWADLDFTTGTLTVQRSLSRLKGGRWELTEPKTTQGRRNVSLPAEAVEVLREHQARQVEERKKYAEFAEDHGLVFADALGRPLEWANVRHRHFAPALRRAIMTCSVCGLPLREPKSGKLEHAGPVLVGADAVPSGHAPAPFAELEGLRPYDLRHVHASLLLARGVSLRTISERLGHADPGFTLSTYAHLVPGTQEAAAVAIGEEVFGKAKA